MIDWLKFYMVSDATFYDCINTLYQFIKPFLDNKMSIFFRNMEPLDGLWKFRVSGLRVKLVSCKSALNPPVVCSTDRPKAVVPVLVLLFVALRFILRGDLLHVFPCVILFLCFSVLLVLQLPRLGKRELILVLFVRLFGLCLFRFVGFLFLLGSVKGCGL